MNSPESVPVIVETTSGKVEGSQRGAVCVFKGIPFATAQRWHAPQRVSAWAGVRSAKQQGHIAPQNPTQLQGLLGTSGGTIGEDCLSLNIWSPGVDSTKRPVMVWIHGGAFTTGAGSLGLYTGKHLAESGNTVIVTINYRLGSFGFLRLADISSGRSGSSGSEGLLDQISALEWVRDNIASFGGDSGNVTIFGESAGAMSVVSLMASPKAKGLFHKAISQSGGGHMTHTREHANRIAEVFVQHSGLSVRELEAAPIEILLKAQLDLINEVDNMHDPHKLGTMPFQPAIDGQVLNTVPIDAVRSGSAKGVALIAGTTSEEWKLWTALDSKMQAMDEGKLARWAERMFGDDAGALLDANAGGSPYERYVFMQTQRAFREPTERLLAAQAGHAAVFDYRFDWKSPAVGGAFGACHAIELGFVFGSHSIKGPDNFFGKGEAADAINRAMMRAWTSFAAGGAPKLDGASWPQWRNDESDLAIFGSQAGPAVVQHLERPSAWAAISDAKIGV
ncbi:MAG: carboxylesterase family protein [Micropepsaceae bacterium]